jgi:gluconolactonase
MAKGKWQKFAWCGWAGLFYVLCPAGAQIEVNAKLETAVSIVFTEGPAADAEGNVYFTEIRGNRILKWSPDGRLSVFREPSGRANGLAFDAQGRLVACEGAGMGEDGRRRVTRTDLKTGRVEVLAERFQGKRLNSPNDLDIDRQGRIYFSDPRYGDQSERELETEDVYRIELDGKLTRVLTKPDIEKPNGLLVSPDGKTLFVADTTAGPPRVQAVKRFDIESDGRLRNGRIHYSFGAGRGVDGMAIDVKGTLYAAAGVNTGPADNLAGIYVISPEGKLLERVPIPEDSVTNCTFGGPGLRTLYITAGKNLYRIRTQVPGYVIYPK